MNSLSMLRSSWLAVLLVVIVTVTGCDSGTPEQSTTQTSVQQPTPIQQQPVQQADQSPAQTAAEQPVQAQAQQQLVQQAEPAGDVKQQYIELKPAQPTQTGDKIEVVEVFWYGCPHCYSFEPFIEEWLKTKPEDVQFIRLPGVLSQNWIPHAKAYYTAEKLGVLDKTHRSLFDTLHKAKQAVYTDDQIRDFFVSQGVAEADFVQTYGSKEVEAKIRQAYFLARDYKLTGVPALVVNGKYVTSPSHAGSSEESIKVINALVEMERQLVR